MTVLVEQLKESKANKDICFLSAEGFDLTFETQLLEVNERNITIANTIPYQHVQAVVNCSRYILQCQKTKIYSSRLENDGVNIVFSFDDSTVLQETREEERFSFRSHQDVVAKICNPFDKVTVITKPILDMSSSGLSIRAKYPSKLFAKGVIFEKLEIHRDGACSKTCSGEVVYSRNYIDLSGKQYCQIGINIGSVPKVRT